MHHSPDLILEPKNGLINTINAIKNNIMYLYMNKSKSIALGVLALTCLSGAGVGVGTGMWLGYVLDKEIKNGKQ